MKVRPFRIPKQIVVPGVVIHVIVVPPSHKDVDDGNVLNASGDFDYNPQTGKCLIRINSTLSRAEQRYTLLHELQHFMVDYLHVALHHNPRWFKV